MWPLRFISAVMGASLLFSCAQTGKQEEVAPSPVQGRWSCFNGCYIVQRDGQYGLEDEAGSELLPAQYQSIEFLDNDVALVSKNSKAFLCDRTGRVLSGQCPPDSLRRNYPVLVAKVLELDRQRWETVLEDYAALCKAGKSARGKRLSRKDFSSIKELSHRLGESLSAVTGHPTPSQKARLESLSNDYRRAFQ